MFVEPVVELELTLVTPVTLLTACSIGSATSSATICGDEPGYVAFTTACGAWVEGISSCLSVVIDTIPNTTTAIDSSATTSLLTRLSRVRSDTGWGSFEICTGVTGALARTLSASDHCIQRREPTPPAQPGLRPLTGP